MAAANSAEIKSKISFPQAQSLNIIRRKFDAAVILSPQIWKNPLEITV